MDERARDWASMHPGLWHKAAEWLSSLGDATTADAWRQCQDGDWMLAFMGELPGAVQTALAPSLLRALQGSIDRAARARMSPEPEWQPLTPEWVDRVRRWWLGALQDDRLFAAGIARVTARLAQAEEDAARDAGHVDDAVREAREWLHPFGVSRAMGLARDLVCTRAGITAFRVELDTQVILDAAREIRDTICSDERRRQADDIRAEIPEWPGEHVAVMRVGTAAGHTERVVPVELVDAPKSALEESDKP